MKKLILLSLLALLNVLPLAALPDFGAQSRIGVPGPGDWELGLFDSGSLQRTGQYVWTSGRPVDWSIAWDSATRNMTYIWGVGTASPVTLAITNSADTKKYLKLWASTSSSVNSSASILMTNLVLKTDTLASNLPDIFVRGASQLAEYTYPIPLADSFVITGSTTMSWTGAQPTRSNMQTWVASTDAVPTPEPTTLTILMGALASALMYGKRRLKAA